MIMTNRKLTRSFDSVKKIFLKIVIGVVLACIFCVYVILPQIPIVKAMMEVSEQQVQNNADDEDIRIKAWRFYTVEFQDNIYCQIFGNGIPSYGNSRWGNYVDKTTGFPKDGGNGCFTVDVGWAGLCEVSRFDSRGGLERNNHAEHEKADAMAYRFTFPWNGSVYCCRCI